MSVAKPYIGIIGGTGLYSLLEEAEEVQVQTPYGPPSDAISVGELGDVTVAFLPRHGKRHQHPPHTIPYAANVWALKSLGVTRILAPAVVGSLQPHVRPGDFVICDQFVDRTRGRKDTFYDGPITTHVSMADPYCPDLRQVAAEAAKHLNLRIHPRGTVVVIQGPRFSSRAESSWFKSAGWEVISMTQYPEVVLAREQELCYANISLVTDYDVWQPEPVSATEVAKVLAENIRNVERLIRETVPKIPADRSCICSKALEATGL
ncbi:MAG: S-methyl-5'-thioadenosine phosphorylase [Candidatus Bathyarchaeia archaeon]